MNNYNPEIRTCSRDGCINEAVTSGRGRILGICAECARNYYKDYHKKYYQGITKGRKPEDQSAEPPNFFHVASNAKTISECRNPKKIEKMIEEIIERSHS
jgi:hypothetical protein